MSSNAIVICTWGEDRTGLPAGAEEVLTLGSNLSRSLDVELNWLTLGESAPGIADVAAQYGVATLQQIDDPKLTGIPSDAAVEALAQYCEQVSPRVVMFNQAAATRTIAPRLAGRIAGTVIMNATELTDDAGTLQVTASAYGGDTRVLYEWAGEGTLVVSVSANAVTAESPDAGTSPAREGVAVDLTSVEERIKVVEAAKSEGPRLEDAEIIVSGGRGLGAVENYKLIRELAAAMGGMAGASPSWTHGQDHQAHVVRRHRHIGCQPAYGGMRRGQRDCRDQQGCGGGHLQARALRDRRRRVGVATGTDPRGQGLTPHSLASRQEVRHVC